MVGYSRFCNGKLDFFSFCFISLIHVQENHPRGNGTVCHPPLPTSGEEGGVYLVGLCVLTVLVSSWTWESVLFLCTTCGVGKAYETNEKKGRRKKTKGVKLVRARCRSSHAEILSDVERRGGNAAPASQVFAHKKLEVFFFFIFFFKFVC